MKWRYHARDAYVLAVSLHGELGRVARQNRRE